MLVIAIDPGQTESAYVVLKPNELAGEIVGHGIAPNSEVWARAVSHVDFQSLADFRLAIELVGHYGTGMPVGAEVFDTCIWTGRFVEQAERSGLKAALVKRQTIKAHVCGSARAKDSNVRQAMLDRWGGKEKAIGRKKTPGPLYGVTSHVWAALALAVYVYDTRPAF